jgi:glycine cleavage system H protein
MAELKVPADLKYAKSDEWVRIEGDTATIGITDYAQDQLNDIVYVELPEVGTEVKQGETFSTIESVKAASDLFAPVSGTITAVNSAVADEPELINTDPYGKGWIVQFRVKGTADGLMDSDAYTAYCADR